jgi:stage II sporulation protein R
MKTNRFFKLFGSFRHRLSNSRAFRLEAALALGIIFSILLTLFTSVAEQRSIASKLVRLHITAASDSEQDQALKLAVRDRLLSELDGELEKMLSCGEAVSFFESSLAEIESIAEDEIRLQGYDYSVCAKLSTELFPEREYTDITLPAGEYTTLRVTIGTGDGANWWCVMFPPLCSFASLSDTSGSYYSFSNREWNTITKKTTGIKIKFKLLEVYSTIIGWFK